MVGVVYVNVCMYLECILNLFNIYIMHGCCLYTFSDCGNSLINILIIDNIVEVSSLIINGEDLTWDLTMYCVMHQFLKYGNASLTLSTTTTIRRAF